MNNNKKNRFIDLIEGILKAAIYVSWKKYYQDSTFLLNWNELAMEAHCGGGGGGWSIMKKRLVSFLFGMSPHTNLSCKLASSNNENAKMVHWENDIARHYRIDFRRGNSKEFFCNELTIILTLIDSLSLLSKPRLFLNKRTIPGVIIQIELRKLAMARM